MTPGLGEGCWAEQKLGVTGWKWTSGRYGGTFVIRRRQSHGESYLLIGIIKSRSQVTPSVASRETKPLAEKHCTQKALDCTYSQRTTRDRNSHHSVSSPGLVSRTTSTAGDRPAGRAVRRGARQDAHPGRRSHARSHTRQESSKESNRRGSSRGSCGRVEVISFAAEETEKRLGERGRGTRADGRAVYRDSQAPKVFSPE
jgi:hypothetical protein